MTDSHINEDDRAIFQSCLNLRRIEEQLNTLYDSLGEALDTEIDGVRFSLDWDDYKSEGWFVTSSCMAAKVQASQPAKRGSKPMLGSVTVAIQFGPSDPDEQKIDWPGYGLAKVVIGWVPGNEDAWNLDDLELDHCENVEALRPEGKRWFWQDGDRPCEDFWLFALPLTGLKSPKDIKKLIRDPIFAVAKSEDGIIGDADLFGHRIGAYLDADGWGG